MNKVVKTTVFMVTGNDFTLLNKVYSEFFETNSLARSTPQVMPFPSGILISVECNALL
jgi:2-iminobutanoate/2-iminopropanoate deaminase